PIVLIPPPASPERLLLIVLLTTFSVQGVLNPSGFSMEMAPPAACAVLPERIMLSRVRLALKLSRMAPPTTSAGLLPEATGPLPSVNLGENAYPPVMVKPWTVAVK